MSYITLGSRYAQAVPDTSGLNQGNYTCQFTAAELNVNVPFYELYSMSVTGLLVVATVTVYVNNRVRSSARLLQASEWDPAQPMLLTPPDEVYLAWSFGTGTPPAATVWLRYDPDIQPGRVS